MASGVQITGLIKPLNGGSFPVWEDIDGFGGWRTVPDVATRDAIPANYRKIGMIATDSTTGINWQLQGGLLNANWVQLAGAFYQIMQDSDGADLPQQPILHFSADFTLTNDIIGTATRVSMKFPQLPTVTTADNGDVLTVVNGIWTPVVPKANVSIRLTAQAAAIGVTNLIALPAAGLYRVSAYLDVTTAGTANSTLSTRVNFTPDDGVASFAIVTSPLNIGSLGGAQGSVVVETNGATALSYEVDLVGAIGTGVFSLRLVVEQIQ